MILTMSRSQLLAYFKFQMQREKYDYDTITSAPTLSTISPNNIENKLYGNIDQGVSLFDNYE